MASIGSLILEDPKKSSIQVKIIQLSQSSLQYEEEEESVLNIDTTDKDNLYKELMDFLKLGTLPLNLNKSSWQAFKIKETKYYLILDVLHRWNFNGILLRCLEWNDIQKVISSTHDGTCEGHFNGVAITKWLIQIGYY